MKRSVEKIPESVFCRGDGFGFAVVEATSTSLRLNYVSDASPPKSLYTCTITKDATTGAISDDCKLACK